jgi:hypothetical protein
LQRERPHDEHPNPHVEHRNNAPAGQCNAETCGTLDGTASAVPGACADQSMEAAAGATLCMPFEQHTDYFPAGKQWMLNLRVDDLLGLIAKLQASGIDVFTKAEWATPETGRFARVLDPEGNAIEFWEPPPTRPPATPR